MSTASRRNGVHAIPVLLHAMRATNVTADFSRAVHSLADVCHLDVQMIRRSSADPQSEQEKAASEGVGCLPEELSARHRPHHSKECSESPG